MAQFNQWVATANEVLTALGQTPRSGAIAYMHTSSQSASEFWIVEKLRGPGVGSGYSVDDTKAFLVQNNQIKNFFTNRGETMPAEIRVRVRPSTPGGYYNDELVVMDSSMTITQL